MWYYTVPCVKGRRPGEATMATMSTEAQDGRDVAVARARILDAAFAAFTERGYAATSTLEIATRARVSKRELYALVGNKQAMLVACIAARAERLQVPADVPEPHDRETLAGALTSFGTQILREITDPAVVAVFRLAIAEAVHAPEVAQALDAIGRETIRAAVRRIMAGAQASGLLDGRPTQLAEQFGALLWGNVMVNLLLGVTERPTSREAAARARDAVAAFLQLHPAPTDAAPRRRQRE
jgi:AcrR family transcriptional regulator